MMATPEDTAATRRGDSARRIEILEAAARLFATAGYMGTSVKDVADACGILAGSLYHHFESKESIAVELLQRYQFDLDSVGSLAVSEYVAPRPEEVFQRVSALGADIASCALRNKAAIQLAQYELSPDASRKLVAVSARPLAIVVDAMRRLLEDARATGILKPNIDVAALSDQLCEAMLHVGASILHRSMDPVGSADSITRTLLFGVAIHAPSDEELDRSPAMEEAGRVLHTWSNADEKPMEDRFAVLQTVARVEFARRGYEATTVRHIAAAASMGIGTVYRTIGSKRELLDSIMRRFHVQLSAAYRAVIESPSTAVEKLDSLTWINLNALESFDKEFEIQRAWFRLSPPETSSVSGAIEERGQLLMAVLSDGQADGEFRRDGWNSQSLTPSVRDLIWMPKYILGRLGKLDALRHSRETILRGARV